MILDTQKNRTKDIRFTTGFNIRMNLGEDGGLTILFCHTDIISRWKGDTTKPKISNKRINFRETKVFIELKSNNLKGIKIEN